MKRQFLDVLLRARLARQPGAAAPRSRSCATTSRPTWLRGAAVDRGDRRDATCARRCARSSSICAASRSASTSIASASRATWSRRCTRSPTASPASTAAGTRPAPGMNFLVHNMCRLPGADGTWMIVEGGMGTVTRSSPTRRASAGAHDRDRPRASSASCVEGGVARGVRAGRRQRAARADVVVVQRRSVPHARAGRRASSCPATTTQRLDGYARDGSTFKVNLALEGPAALHLPARGPRPVRPDDPPAARRERRDARRCATASPTVQAGRLPTFPTIEWYIHTTVDPVAAATPTGHHNSALFVQWVPYELAGIDLGAGGGALRRSTCCRSAIASRPARRDLVVDTFPLHPQKIEQHFGITRGHIHHVDNALRLRRSPALRHADRRPLLVQRRLPPGRLGDRRRRPQRRHARAQGSGAARRLLG